MSLKIESPDPSSLSFSRTSSPFYWLTRVGRRYYHVMDEALKSSGMDVIRWRILMILTEFDHASVTEISKHAVIKLSTMTKTLARMQKEGLIATAPRKNDARVTEATLTDAGVKAVSEVRITASRIFYQAFDGFLPEEIENLNMLLLRIHRNLESFPG